MAPRILAVIQALALCACTSTLEQGEQLYRQGDVRGAIDLWRAVPENSGEFERTQQRLQTAEVQFQRTLQRYEKIGLDQVVTTPGAGWYDPHERVIESIGVVGEKVLPRLRA